MIDVSLEESKHIVVVRLPVLPLFTLGMMIGFALGVTLTSIMPELRWMLQELMKPWGWALC